MLFWFAASTDKALTHSKTIHLRENHGATNSFNYWRVLVHCREKRDSFWIHEGVILEMNKMNFILFLYFVSIYTLFFIKTEY